MADILFEVEEMAKGGKEPVVAGKFTSGLAARRAAREAIASMVLRNSASADRYQALLANFDKFAIGAPSDGEEPRVWIMAVDPDAADSARVVIRTTRLPTAPDNPHTTG
jgi:hypothetical protein